MCVKSQKMKNSENGFSFVEVLIALLILSVGIAGSSSLLIEAKAIQQITLKQQKVTLTKLSPSRPSLQWNIEQ
jgi:prepilin-type N-terminal cleavage/methylation domain-containing protein